MKTTTKSSSRSTTRDANQSKSIIPPLSGIFLGNKALNELRILIRLASSGARRNQFANSR